MREYKNLLKQEFSIDNYLITPIRDKDKWVIMKTRNEQMFHLRQQNPLTELDQENYFKNIISELFLIDKPNQLLFSFLKDGEFVGYGGLVHINWEEKSAEISFIMLTNLEKENFSKNWTVFIKLIESVAFEELRFTKIYTYSYDLRPHLYPILERCGYILTDRLSKEIDFNGELIDVLINSKLNPNIFFRKAEIRDVDLIYEWANDSSVRLNSFNSDPIDYKKHCDWFYKCLKNNLINIFIFYNQFNVAVGIIRIQKINEKESIISMSVDQCHRGKGIAKKISEIGSYYYKGLNLNSLIIAYIKPSNIATLKIYRDIGYREVESDSNLALKFIL